MKVSLIVCTYMRPEPLLRLLKSVTEQTVHPAEILIIDGSTTAATQQLLNKNKFNNLHYYLVPESHRGLTKQRNYGITKVNRTSEIVAFLDDDTELTPNYFQELVKTFTNDPAVTGVGGIALNENGWSVSNPHIKYDKYRYFQWEGYVYKEGQRNVFRNYLGLQSNLGPGKMPNYSHGKTCGFPSNGKTHEVDLLVGMSFAFHKSVFDSIRFSTHFEGYGLYEDADFSIRALAFGKNVINTNLQLYHYHDASGRPNKYQYGKMVVRNGWYVWRTKNPQPTLEHQLKWHAITILLTVIRFSNTFTTSKRMEAFSEAMGRTVGWWSLWVSKPKVK
ncbi:glycosyltransferase family 2 protein [Flavobacterium sandaracinum]|uniref:Glycosyltransferase n=1 Tax=Flavobacterium sandaracinum TaxID=2541733 RepID=A0A4R5CU79_9FLAO|nr:glycosyltransferase [Flavobacterium sandaracinum]TDE02034.1 glycosyltransferase [Flavobacterium sandaracinum]